MKLMDLYVNAIIEIYNMKEAIFDMEIGEPL